MRSVTHGNDELDDEKDNVNIIETDVKVFGDVGGVRFRIQEVRFHGCRHDVKSKVEVALDKQIDEYKLALFLFFFMTSIA